MKKETYEEIGQIFDRYLDLLGDGWLGIAALFAAPIVIGVAWRLLAPRIWREHDSGDRAPGRWSRVLSWAVVIASACAAVWLALDKASVVDDAFISCRYARNLAEGHGLVFNEGERVQGYTNFLWTVLIALFVAVTPLEAPFIALCLALAAMVGNLIAVFRIGRLLAGRHGVRVYIPLAVALMAVQATSTDFGTTGLETAGASLFVNLGVYFLIRDDRVKNRVIAGSMFILAVLTRPDHSIFFCAAGLAVAIRSVRPIARSVGSGIRSVWTAGLKGLLAFASPLAAYGIYLLWKIAYYGSVLPNTYYARSANLTYFEQGLVYAATFFAGAHFWLLTLLFVLFLIWPCRSEPARRLKLFSGISFLAFGFYVLKVGGDFMYGRFFVPLIPLLLLGAEEWIYARTAGGRSSGIRAGYLAALAVTGLFLGTAGGVPIIGPSVKHWRVANEPAYYPVTQFFPIEIKHINYRAAQFWKKTLTDRGIRPTIATSGIGMVGYYTRLELIDLCGLTDAYVASLPLKERGRPGHEKWAPPEYLRKRKVALGRLGAFAQRYRRYTELKTARKMGKEWRIFIYQREIMRRIKRLSPEIGFVDFEEHLDKYIAGLGKKSKSTVKRDLEWFKMYYFDFNDDPERLEAISSFLER